VSKGIEAIMEQILARGLLSCRGVRRSMDGGSEMSVRPGHHETNPEPRGTTIRTAWATLLAFAILAAMLVFTVAFAHMSRG